MVLGMNIGSHSSEPNTALIASFCQSVFGDTLGSRHRWPALTDSPKIAHNCSRRAFVSNCMMVHLNHWTGHWIASIETSMFPMWNWRNAIAPFRRDLGVVSATPIALSSHSWSSSRYSTLEEQSNHDTVNSHNLMETADNDPSLIWRCVRHIRITAQECPVAFWTTHTQKIQTSII